LESDQGGYSRIVFNNSSNYMLRHYSGNHGKKLKCHSAQWILRIGENNSFRSTKKPNWFDLGSNRVTSAFSRNGLKYSGGDSEILGFPPEKTTLSSDRYI